MWWSKVSERKTPNVASQRLRFLSHSVANPERDRGDGDGEAGRAGGYEGRRCRQAKFINQLFGVTRNRLKSKPSVCF